MTVSEHRFRCRSSSWLEVAGIGAAGNLLPGGPTRAARSVRPGGERDLTVRTARCRGVLMMVPVLNIVPSQRAVEPLPCFPERRLSSSSLDAWPVPHVEAMTRSRAAG